MKLRLTLIATAMTLSGMALAAGEYSSPSDTSESAGVVEGGAGSAESGASGSQSQSGLLSVIDRDGDGKITEEELTSHFQQSDANGDGSLDESEFAAFEGGGAGGGMQMPSDQPASPDTGTMEQSPSDMGTSPETGTEPGATGQ